MTGFLSQATELYLRLQGPMVLAIGENPEALELKAR